MSGKQEDVRMNGSRNVTWIYGLCSNLSNFKKCRRQTSVGYIVQTIALGGGFEVVHRVFRELYFA